MRFSFSRFLWTLAFTALILAISLSIIDRKFFSRPSAAQQQAEQRKAALENEREAGVRATASEVEQLLDDAERRLQAASEQTSRWHREIEPLQSGEAGQKIAADEQLTDQMAYLLAEERPSTAALADISEQIQRQRKALSEASGSPDARISIADLERIRELHAQASEAQQDWQQALDRAGAIVREAERRAAGVGPAEGRTLSDSMQAAQDREALTSLEEQRARQQQEAEVGAEKQRERERLQEAAKSPEVQSALALFLAARSVQPRLSGSSIVMEKMFDERPMSLSRLEQIGALEPTREGLKLLARVGTDRDLPQPRWSFPAEPGNWSPENEAVLKTAQSLLRTYGTTLVRLGQLSP